MQSTTPDDQTIDIGAPQLSRRFDLLTPLFRNRVAVVTGATHGIGRALALYFARLGARVVIDGRDRVSLAEVAVHANELTGSLSPIPGDVTDPGHRDRLVREAESLGGVDILVNNAGVIIEKPLIETADEDWRYVLETNLDATFALTRLVGHAMLPRGRGKIVNVSSILGTRIIRREGAYCVSKGAVEQLTRAFAVEWAGRGVNVNAIAPGYVKTRMNHEYRNDSDSRDALRSSIPAGRFGELEDVVGPALFLSSSLSDYCHGAILVVDGGYLCR